MEVVGAEIEPSLRRRLVLGGDAMSGRDACSAGLVDETVPAAGLVPRAIEVARTRSAAASYARVKEQLRREVVARLRRIVEDRTDPMARSWIER